MPGTAQGAAGAVLERDLSPPPVGQCARTVCVTVKASSEGELTGVLALAILSDMSDLTPELARLSPRQRLDLIESLWESLDDDVPLTDTQRAELDRRIAGFDQEREQSIPWDQRRADLGQRR